MRYRIIIEVDTDETNRKIINNLALYLKDEAVTTWCNPVYVATEIVDEHSNIYSLPEAGK
jgi:hypothetical protein